jgi:uncharacterized protein (TIGR03067 family)
MNRSSAIRQAAWQDTIFEKTDHVSTEAPTPVKTELEGTWRALDATIAGEPAPQIIGQHLTFDGNRFQIGKEDVLRYGGCFSLNPDGATIDLVQTETDNLPGVWRGIYKRVGDILVICDNAADMARPRPAGFGQAHEEGYVWAIFTRQN